jgi:hypothetical protein
MSEDSKLWIGCGSIVFAHILGHVYEDSKPLDWL